MHFDIATATYARYRHQTKAIVCSKQEDGAVGGCEGDVKTQQTHPKRPTRFHRAASVSDFSQAPSESSRRALGRSQSLDTERDASPDDKSHNPSRRNTTTPCNSDRSGSGSSSGGSRTQSASSDSAMDKKTVWKSINGASAGLNRETRRFIGFFKQKLRSKRGKKETAIKEIHISPEDDEERWACRAGAENNSRTSSSATNYSNSRENTGLEVVHDMDEEYNPEYR